MVLYITFSLILVMSIQVSSLQANSHTSDDLRGLSTLMDKLSRLLRKEKSQSDIRDDGSSKSEEPSPFWGDARPPNDNLAAQVSEALSGDTSAKNQDPDLKILGSGSSSSDPSDNELDNLIKTLLSAKFWSKLKKNGADPCSSELELTEASGMITSPNYPGPYSSSLNCRWHIIAAPDQKLSLHFNSLNLQGYGEDCQDFILVESGTDDSRSLEGVFCNRSRGDIEIYSNHVWITFMSDDSFSGSGFSLDYTAGVKP